MRTNLPITENCYAFPTGHTLVSTTDTKGRILYCNAKFIEVSGFAKEELLGQPHNLIRHPDMPEEAFRDMWQTIASGKSWSAPVKNRRKNGDYYWVMANATPLIEDDNVVGYMSVRTEATQQQIAKAEALYSIMRQEKAQGHAIHQLVDGRLRRATLGGRAAEWMQPALDTKLLLVLLTVLLASAAGAWLMPQSIPMRGAILLGLDLLWVGAAWRYLIHISIRPLDSLIHAANRMAAGDLTHPIEHSRSDQVGDLQQALGQLSVNLLSIVRDARDQSEQMQVATREIGEGNHELAQRTEAQASSLEQTAASMEEITSTVRRTAEVSQQASQLSAEVCDVAERSGHAVNEVSQTMAEIQGASRRIAEITHVIESIAFQTNILALNAAIEAARAGEQGRGFAVVASEVRSLAERSSGAAREIKNLIQNSTTTVDAGYVRTETAKATLQEAVSGVHKVNAMMSEISTATSEQLSGIAQINAAVNQLDGITQQNAALVEQVVASAMNLDQQAHSVNETVQIFRLDGQPRTQRADAVALRRLSKSTPSAAEPAP